MSNVIGLESLFLEVGGVSITGFGSDAITIPTPDNITTSKEGLDNVAWLKKNPKSQELLVVVNLMADSASVKVLKGFEKTGVIVPFRFEWDELGVYVEALDAVVAENGDFKVGIEMPELQFEIKVKNFVEIKGL